MAKTTESKNAKRLVKLYNTKAHGTSHQTVLRLIREQGLDGAIRQLGQWGMKPEFDDGT